MGNTKQRIAITEVKQLAPMSFSFMERDGETALSEETAKAIITDTGQVSWSGKNAEVIRTLLRQHKWFRLNRQGFDEGNPSHWLRLPELLDGQRLWVVKES